MSKIFKIMSGLLLFAPSAVMAQVVEKEGVWYSIVEGYGSAAVEVTVPPTGAPAYQGEVEVATGVTIKSTQDGEPSQQYVTVGIGKGAFSGCTTLTDVKLPSTLEYISDYAFFGCTALRSVNLPEGLVTIADRSFTDCSALESVTLPRSLYSVGENAFSRCNTIGELIFPDRLEQIGDGAFSYCDRLETIDFRGSQIEYGIGAFQGCHNLQNLHFNPDQQSIQAFTFAGCSGLKNLTLPKSLLVVGEQAFADCISLRQIDLPQNMERIGQRAFAAALALDSIGFYAKELTIGPGAFEGATNLESLILRGVKSVGEGAFRSCLNLRLLEIGTEMESIDSDAFLGCGKLDEIYSQPELPPMIYSNSFTTSQEQNATLYVLPGLRRRYMLATHWSRFEHVEETQRFPSSSDTISSVYPQIHVVKGGAQIMAEGADVRIYDIQGVECRSMRIEGSEFIALEPGIYIVHADGRNRKIYIR